MQPAPKPEGPVAAERPVEKAADKAVDDSWRQWIAENRLRDCSADSVIDSMVAAGFDPNLASKSVMAMERDPVFLAARRHQQLLRKLESVVANQQRLHELVPGYAHIERRPLCGRAEFVERYAGGSRPVVFTDLAAGWPALQRWTAEALKARFGAVPVFVQGAEAAALAGVTSAPPRPPMPLAAFLDRLLGGDAALQLVPGQRLLQGALAGLLDDVGALPAWGQRVLLEQQGTIDFAAAGRATPLQHGHAMQLHTQAVGRSRWRFVSPLQGPLLYNYRGSLSSVDIDQPDLVRHPAFAQAHVIEVVAEAGDTVFVPLGWWWQATALDFGVVLAGPHVDLPNQYHHADPDLRNW